MKEQVKTGGMSIGTIVFFIFLFMKLSGTQPVAEWSWWWVTAPLWLPTVIIVGIFLGITIIGFLGIIVASILEYIYEKF